MFIKNNQNNHDKFPNKDFVPVNSKTFDWKEFQLNCS